MTAGSPAVAAAEYPAGGDHPWHGMQITLQQTPVAVREIMAGGIAGATAKTCVAPLERCKILFQTGKLHSGGVYTTLANILRSEGPRGLFRGNGASVLRIVPYSTIHFALYEEYRRLAIGVVYAGAERHTVSPLLDLAAGSAAGATAVLATYPLDLVRTRLAFVTEGGSGCASGGGSGGREMTGGGTGGRSGSVGRSPVPAGHPPRGGPGSSPLLPAVPPGGGATGTGAAGAPPGSGPAASGPRPPSSRSLHLLSHADPRLSIRGVLLSTLRLEGLRGLYHGLGPSMYGILPYAGLKFYVYQSLKQLYFGANGVDMRQAGPGRGGGGGAAAAGTPRLPVPAMLGFGAVAGLVAQTVTYPLDVVRRRMQVEGLKLRDPGGQPTPRAHLAAHEPLPQSTPAALVAIARRQGWRALYSGLTINYLKVVPSTAIGFTIYDFLKSSLNLPTNL